LSSNIQDLSIEEKQQAIVKWLGTGSINVFGRPFAGKDLQCANLSKWIKAPVIGGGEIIRTQQEAQHLREAHDKGELVDTNEFIRIITNYFSKDEFEGSPLIFSSIGRWHGEEPPIMEAAEKSSHPLKAVIYIEISENTARQRLHLVGGNRSRDDDSQQVLDTRMQEFATKTQPVINFYKDAGILITVNGDQTPEQVQADIVNKLYKLANTSRA
jgi:adenylate kinase